MDKIAVLDFGGQYTHLIANRIRRLSVYSEILPCETSARDLASYKGLVLSGGPHSVTDDASPTIDPAVLSTGIPILGLCYGHQLIAKVLGGTVARGDVREYGVAEIEISVVAPLFEGLEERQQVWMSHGDAVTRLPPGFVALAATQDCTGAAVADLDRRIYGLQFHPEVTDTPNGMAMLDNFVRICECRREWSPDAFLREMRSQILETCRGKRVFLLVSGGVDSTVAFSLLNETLGADRVVGLHIDNGLMRHGESETIMQYMREHGFDNLHVVDASREFLSALEGVVDPEAKRMIIGNTFLEVKEKAQSDLGLGSGEWLLGQGTIYPDTIESAGTRHADRIKTHHNRVDIVLELIEKGLVIEPLAQLYKDEVRALGAALGLPHELLWRHPFPGPALGVRVLCSSGREELPDAAAVAAVRDKAVAAGYAGQVLPLRSVGVQGDGRTYAHPALVLGGRDWSALEDLSTAITNSVPGVNRVVYGLRVAGSANYRLRESYLTRARLDRIRRMDRLVTEALQENGEYDAIWQMPVVLLPLVNESGNECVVLRPIRSREAMTVRFAHLSDATIDHILRGAENLEGIGDILYDVTHKPPATIEWE